MRKSVKREILYTIGSLKTMNQKIADIKSVGNAGIFLNYLEQCQNIAIRIGDMIEKTEGEGTASVSALEQYCEAIYQVSLNAQAEGKSLEECLTRAEREIEKIPEQKEAVFLPYKASMWDSLEGIWRRLEADESYITYVIPIPYFDKKPDGTLGDMHYEALEYPKDVPVVSWKSYDLEENRPDEIYIHNPYDSDNFVTSVHPDFYASRICKLTDKLVYVPYFVGIDDKVPEHLCVLPGTLFAHKIYVESDNVKRIYLDSLKEFEKQHKCKGVFGDFEKKIEVHTASKYEKVEKTEWQDVDIPEQWNELIVGQNGKRKKVILYNTTIDGLLNNSAAVLEKISHTLEVFERNREVVLLWRPHPLYKTTIQSMRPELLNGYNEIAEKYKNGGWGIYDDTADLNRAIAIADAYYGDASSLVSLCKKVYKPIMIQNYNFIK